VEDLGVQDVVLFAGPLFGSDVVPAYVDADLFALTPRVYEETSLAGLEACFCGTQVLVTEQAETPHLVGAGAGFCVPATEEGVFAALLTALADDCGIAERGAAARAMAYEHYDWTKVVNQYIRAYAIAAGQVPRESV
jgi:glycosyltransferase involved in cell wall biosynthesis